MEITLTAGTLPPPACYASEQERFEAYVAAITATATGDIQWHSGSVAPVDTTLYWLVLDVDDRPLEVRKYSTDDASWIPVLQDVVWCSNGGGTLGNYTVAPVPAFLTSASAYQFGRIYAFKVPHTNTGAATLNVNGLGSKNITKNGTVALAAGDLVVNQLVLVMYDGTQFQLLNPTANTTVAVASIVPGTDRQFLRTNSTPATQWESGYITPVGSYQSVPSAGAAVTLAHGLGVLPLSWEIGIICTADDATTGYVAGDFIPVGSIFRGNLSETEHWISKYANSTNIGFVRGNSVSSVQVNHKTNGVLQTITDANWKVCGFAIR